MVVICGVARTDQAFSSAPSRTRTDTWRILSPDSLSDWGSCNLLRRPYSAAKTAFQIAQKCRHDLLAACATGLPTSSGYCKSVDATWTRTPVRREAAAPPPTQRHQRHPILQPCAGVCRWGAGNWPRCAFVTHITSHCLANIHTSAYEAVLERVLIYFRRSARFFLPG